MVERSIHILSKSNGALVSIAAVYQLLAKSYNNSDDRFMCEDSIQDNWLNP